MMLFKTITNLIVFCILSTIVLSEQSQSIGSVAITPLDYDKYADTIDLKLLRFFDSGEVFFYDSEVTNYSNETRTVNNATILSSGQFLVNSDGNDYYLMIDDTSGVVSITKDSGSINGLFYVDNNYLFYQYHKIFVACQNGPDAHNYTLTWKGASSSAICEHDWLLVFIKPYGSSSGAAVSSYYPNEYVASIASTATDNTQTSTTTNPVSPTVSASSTNMGNVLMDPGAGVFMSIGLSLLAIGILSFMN